MSVSTRRGDGCRVGAPGSDVHIRQMTEAHLPRVRELRRVVGWYAEPEAFDLLRGTREAKWAVAESSGGVVRGMVGAVPLEGIGILCHLAVCDEDRGFGLGSSLTRWAIAYLKSRGAKTIRLYTTPQAERLYRSLGFEPGERRVIYRSGERTRTGLPTADGIHVETLRFGDLPELYGLDRWSYGADRSHIILATLRLHPGRGLVARDESGRMKGYLVRSQSRDETRVGPFMAADEDAARLLLYRAVEGEGGPLRAIVPGDSPAHGLFREFGFVGARDRLEMELGETPAPRGLEAYATTAYLAT